MTSLICLSLLSCVCLLPLQLLAHVGMTRTQVTYWFSNKRRRERKDSGDSSLYKRRWMPPSEWKALSARPRRKSLSYGAIHEASRKISSLPATKPASEGEPHETPASVAVTSATIASAAPVSSSSVATSVQSPVSPATESVLPSFLLPGNSGLNTDPPATTAASPQSPATVTVTVSFTATEPTAMAASTEEVTATATPVVPSAVLEEAVAPSTVSKPDDAEILTAKEGSGESGLAVEVDALSPSHVSCREDRQNELADDCLEEGLAARHQSVSSFADDLADCTPCSSIQPSPLGETLCEAIMDFSELVSTAEDEDEADDESSEVSCRELAHHWRVQCHTENMTSPNDQNDVISETEHPELKSLACQSSDIFPGAAESPIAVHVDHSKDASDVGSLDATAKEDSKPSCVEDDAER